MKRDEIAVEFYREGFWKPWRVNFQLPAGHIITGRGWNLGQAFKNARDIYVRDFDSEAGK
jgi:hypothetical protein